MDERCAIPGCRNVAGMTYVGNRPLCWSCWGKYTREGQPHTKLRDLLGLPVSPDERERAAQHDRGTR